MNWFKQFSRLRVEDLRRISRLADLLSSTDWGKSDQARAMLAARPVPETSQDARRRLESIISHLDG